MGQCGDQRNQSMIDFNNEKQTPSSPQDSNQFQTTKQQRNSHSYLGLQYF